MITRERGQQRPQWMIHGPGDYIPSVHVDVLERRKAIPLDKNEGLYVRDIKSGELRLIRGPQAYMLPPYEERWEKELPPIVETLVAQRSDSGGDRGSYQLKAKGKEEGTNAREPIKRDKTRAVVFHVPQNAAVQIHDYKLRR